MEKSLFFWILPEVHAALGWWRPAACGDLQHGPGGAGGHPAGAGRRPLQPRHQVRLPAHQSHLRGADNCAIPLHIRYTANRSVHNVVLSRD